MRIIAEGTIRQWAADHARAAVSLRLMSEIINPPGCPESASTWSLAKATSMKRNAEAQRAQSSAEKIFNQTFNAGFLFR